MFLIGILVPITNVSKIKELLTAWKTVHHSPAIDGDQHFVFNV